MRACASLASAINRFSMLWRISCPGLRRDWFPMLRGTCPDRVLAPTPHRHPQHRPGTDEQRRDRSWIRQIQSQNGSASAASGAPRRRCAGR